MTILIGAERFQFLNFGRSRNLWTLVSRCLSLFITLGHMFEKERTGCV